MRHSNNIIYFIKNYFQCRFRLLFSVSSVLISLYAPPLNAQETVLDSYIEKALAQNESFKQAKLNVEIQNLNLVEAKGNYYPSLSFNARYTVADGGRTIDFPLADLLHPVYNSLNQLTRSDQFSPLINNTENVAFQFYRPQEHETKLHLVQPVYNRNIKLNYIIKKDLLEAERNTINTQKLALIAEVKSSYYSYLQAQEVLELMKEILEVYAENVRVTKSLFDNQKVTIDYFYAARAELARHSQKIVIARKNLNMSRSYFNFLIGEPLETEIKKDAAVQPDIQAHSIDSLQESALLNRPELETIRAYQSAKEHEIATYKANNMPSVAAVIDYGFQGETYKFNKEQDFVLASLVLQWELFKGFQNKAKVKKSLLEKQQFESRSNELKAQINLEIIQAYYELQAAEESYHAMEAETRAKAQAYEVVNRKYIEGQTSILELTTAQSAYTTARQQQIISRYDILIAMAKLEKAAGITNYYQ